MISNDPEPQTAMALITAVKTAFNARLGDRKRSTKDEDEEKGHLLIRVLPATRDRRFEGLKSSLASALFRQEPYEVMTSLVIQEVARIELGFQERPQVHTLKSPQRFGRSDRGYGRANFNKRSQRGGHRQHPLPSDARCTQADHTTQGNRVAGVDAATI